MSDENPEVESDNHFVSWRAANKANQLEWVVDKFLATLKSGGPKDIEFDLMLEVLWRFYLEPVDRTQREVATDLGMLESDVHDCRALIEGELQALCLHDVNDPWQFESILHERVRGLRQPLSEQGSSKSGSSV